MSSAVDLSFDPLHVHFHSFLSGLLITDVASPALHRLDTGCDASVLAWAEPHVPYEGWLGEFCLPAVAYPVATKSSYATKNALTARNSTTSAISFLLAIFAPVSFIEYH
ncbi:MAG: hypothetical protein QMD97_05165 [Candidatus Aenigmarchaeota archaeon]|nr:hypothetical protein [Candidatus Aenigmarchaeota archaeon]